MNGFEAIKKAATSSGVSVRSVLLNCGRSETLVNNGINRGSSPATNTAAQLLGACGYVLAAVPAEDVPPTAIVID